MWEPQGAWIVDIRHWADADPADKLPLGLLRRRAFHGHIISAATVVAQNPFVSAIPCCRRPNRKVCSGVIAIERDNDPEPFIYWTCLRCEYHGRIAGYRGCWYDLGRYHAADSEKQAALSLLVTLAEYGAVLFGSMLAYSPGALRVVYSAQSDGSRVVLSGSKTGFALLASALAADVALEKNRARRKALQSLQMRLDPDRRQ
jgi:hypothetical protein